MTVSITQIILVIVAGIAALLGFSTGKKRGQREGERIGREQAISEINAATAEHTLEVINEANEAGDTVERRTPDGVRDAARTDPHNAGRVRRT